MELFDNRNNMCSDAFASLDIHVFQRGGQFKLFRDTDHPGRPFCAAVSQGPNQEILLENADTPTRALLRIARSVGAVSIDPEHYAQHGNLYRSEFDYRLSDFPQSLEIGHLSADKRLRRDDFTGTITAQLRQLDQHQAFIGDGTTSEEAVRKAFGSTTLRLPRPFTLNP